LRSFAFTETFLRDLRALEPDLSKADLEYLDRLLAAIVRKPDHRSRVATYYDPLRPSWLLRSGPFAVHYAFDSGAVEVTFLNLFRVA
jgi:mRNA-degrading endonuclease RelE of RelBE toxin-antitoxin system